MIRCIELKSNNIGIGDDKGLENKVFENHGKSEGERYCK